MDQHRAVSASPPGPLSTYVERGRAVATLLLTLAVGCRGVQSTGSDPAHANDPRAFVADFYAWYHPDSATTGHEGPAKEVDDALRERIGAFTPELRNLLLADRKCVGESGEICILDFDPFLASQDPCDRFEVGVPVFQGDSVVVRITALCGPVREPIPAVDVVVIRDADVWRFSNFLYGNAHNLRDMLNRKTPG